MKKRFLVYLILFQLIIVFAITYKIYQKKSGVLGTKTFITPISTTEIESYPVDNLKYFYQLKKNTSVKLNSNLVSNLGYFGDERIIYSLNSDGLNSTEDYNTEKEKGVYRIVAVGDSFTFGQNVSTENNYPSQLEEMLNKYCTQGNIKNYEVINLGVPGYDFQYTVERYKLKGQKYNPDLVLWLNISDDFMRINEILRPKLFDIQKQKEQDKDYNWITNNLVKNNWNQALAEEIQEEGGSGKVLSLQSKYLSEMNSFFSKKLVMLPFSDTDSAYMKVLDDFAKTRGGISIHKVPVEIDRLTDGHPSPKGYSTIVPDIFKYITEDKIIPCKV